MKLDLKSIFNEDENPKNIGDIFAEKKAKQSDIIGYDFHETLDTGITPEENAVVITGADKSHTEEIESYLESIGRSDIQVYYRPSEYEDTPEGIAKWKTSIIQKLGIKTYYDDYDEVIEHLKEMNPDVNIIDVDGPDDGSEEESDDGDKFLVISTYGELLDVCMKLQKEGKKVMLCITDQEHKKIGEGIVPKYDDWHSYIGKGWIWCVDGCEHASLQDWLREQGEYVVGTNQVMSEYENDRQKGQELFKKAGFKQPDSQNFTDIDEALSYVQDNSKKRFILKQNGSAPKSINHMGKFDDSSDMVYHLNELKKKWNESDYGPVDFDLMEVVDGVEVACSAFWNGHDWLRNKDGKAVAFLNFEEKKESDNGMGETTGETGTTFYGTDERNPIAKEILFKKEIEDVLRESDYRGVFDINGSLTEDGFVAFEPTSRFGVPATSYEFIAGIKSKTSDLLKSMAMGEDTTVRIVKGWGMVVVLTSKPYPSEAHMGNEHTSIGEKLWILEDGKPVDDFDQTQGDRVHLENFYKDDEGDYKVATSSGYLLVVSGSGATIKGVRNDIAKFIKDNLYISGQKHRMDIGSRVEDNL